MIFYVVLISGISIYEIRIMIKSKLKKEMVLFIAFDIIALSLAWIYSKNPYGISISDSILSMLGIKH